MAWHLPIISPQWPPERRLVESGYRTMPFPFAELPAPPFVMACAWDLGQLLGYFRTWSATARFTAARGYDPVAEVERILAPLWGDPAARRRIVWPLSLRAGRKAL